MSLDWSLVRACADACAAVYDRATWRLPRAHALLTESNGVHVIACRGTASLRDILTDADVALTPAGEGRCHHGVMTSARELVDAMQSCQLTGPVIVTGHSLGGAQARHVARALASRMMVAGLITFGELRGGDGSWARSWQGFGEDWRIVHEVDIVPRMPPLSLGYRHAGRLVLLTDDGPLESPGLLSRIHADLRAIWHDVRNRRLGLYLDHGIDAYREALKSPAEAGLA